MAGIGLHVPMSSSTRDAGMPGYDGRAQLLYVAKKMNLVNAACIPTNMLPTKRAYKTKSLDKKEFSNKALLLAEFPDHDLKFRSSAGKYTYYVCSRCQMRVAAQCTGEGEGVLIVFASVFCYIYSVFISIEVRQKTYIAQDVQSQARK